MGRVLIRALGPKLGFIISRERIGNVHLMPVNGAVQPLGRRAAPAGRQSPGPPEPGPPEPGPAGDGVCPPCGAPIIDREGVEV